MKSHLKHRLKSYSITAGAIIASGAANAKLVYTDVNPDQTFTTDGDFYDLDLNNDAIIDFRINLLKNTLIFGSTMIDLNTVELVPMNSNEVAISTSSSYALAMNKNDIIGPAITSWASNTNTMAFKITINSYSGTSSSSYGNWNGAIDKYLGLKLVVSGQTYYGWARLDVNTSTGTFTIKDYAFEDVANTPIDAGIVPAEPATNVVGNDIADNSNGSDLGVTFDKAANELTVGNYRIMVVKSANAGTFDLPTAQGVASADYTSVAPTGSNISTTLSAGSTDVDGDPIAIGIPYKIFVMSVADGVIASDDVLSDPSNDITLNTTAPVAFNLNAKDVDNKLSSEDMEISFSKALNESGIAEYRVIFLKTADAAGFTKADAQAVITGNYISINPGGSDIQQTLPSSAKDKDGDDIVLDVAYRYFVLSIADGTVANIDELSSPSSEITLTNTIGIRELSEVGVKVFANGNSITVDMGKAKLPGARLRIIDITGKTVADRLINNSKITLNLQEANGIYVVDIFAEEKVLRKKIILNQ